MMTSGNVRAIAAVAAGTLVLSVAACGSAGPQPAVVDCPAFAQYGDIAGMRVSVYTPLRGTEADLLQRSWKEFTDCTGVQIDYEGSDEFETDIVARVASGQAPDIAFFPQPGLIGRFADSGGLKPLEGETQATARQNYPDTWLDYGTFGGRLYATPMDASVKSLVWFSPKKFRDNGWRIPKNWDDMIALSDTIAASGTTPWCAGVESGVATGWPLTDWVEDVLLREHGPEVYDQWVRHEIAFNDPRVVSAVDRVGSVLRNDRYVNGGIGDVKSIATTSYQEGGWPILRGECAMHRQGSFYANLWPAGTTVAPDGDVFAFYLPSIRSSGDNPVLGAGHFVAGFSDRPEVRAVRAYLAGGEFANSRARLGNWISANTRLNLANVESPINRLTVQMLRGSDTVFRFDGSDLMPPEVGAGTFWKCMTEWIIGKDTSTVLDSIEDSWQRVDPASSGTTRTR